MWHQVVWNMGRLDLQAYALTVTSLFQGLKGLRIRYWVSFGLNFPDFFFISGQWKFSANTKQHFWVTMIHPFYEKKQKPTKELT